MCGDGGDGAGGVVAGGGDDGDRADAAILLDFGEQVGEAGAAGDDFGQDAGGDAQVVSLIDSVDLRFGDNVFVKPQSTSGRFPQGTSGAPVASAFRRKK